MSEGRELSKQYNTYSFHEVSVADNPVDTINVMNELVRELWVQKVLKILTISSIRAHLHMTKNARRILNEDSTKTNDF